jgi:hypothetical protein
MATATAGPKRRASVETGSAGWSQCRSPLDGGLEGLDSRRGCYYVPMDLFIDNTTVQAHFHVSAIRARRERVRSTLLRSLML